MTLAASGDVDLMAVDVAQQEPVLVWMSAHQVHEMRGGAARRLVVSDGEDDEDREDQLRGRNDDLPAAPWGEEEVVEEQHEQEEDGRLLREGGEPEGDAREDHVVALPPAHLRAARTAAEEWFREVRERCDGYIGRDCCSDSIDSKKPMFCSG